MVELKLLHSVKPVNYHVETVNCSIPKIQSLYNVYLAVIIQDIPFQPVNVFLTKARPVQQEHR